MFFNQRLIAKIKATLIDHAIIGNGHGDSSPLCSVARQRGFLPHSHVYAFPWSVSALQLHSQVIMILAVICLRFMLSFCLPAGLFAVCN